MIPMPAVDLPGQLEAEQEAARAEFDAAIAEALGAEPAIEIEKRLVEGDAGDALVSESAGADLVVVGPGGASAGIRFLLGSVSHRLLTLTDCDTLIVPRVRRAPQLSTRSPFAPPARPPVAQHPRGIA